MNAIRIQHFLCKVFAIQIAVKKETSIKYQCEALKFAKKLTKLHSGRTTSHHD